MKCCRQCILSEIIQSQKCGESGSTHAAHQGTLLRIKTIRPDTLMSHQMQGLVFICVVCLLKNSHIINTTFMQIFVFIHIYRVDLDSDILKIFSCDLHRFPDICNIRICPALACQDQNFFHAGMRNNLHLMLDLLHRQLLPADVVITVEATVNAVVLAIVCNIKRCEDIDRISKMILRDLLCFPCHLFQIRCCCR